MPNCSVCSKQATVQYQGTGTPIPYCDSHLPSFARRPEYANLVVPVAPVAPVIEEPAPKPSKKSVKVETPSEAPAEETIETAPEEEPEQ